MAVEFYAPLVLTWQEISPPDLEGYEIDGELDYCRVVEFNRIVCEAHDPVPQDSLLIKEGYFEWKVAAAEIWPQYTTGGSKFYLTGEDTPEYRVTVAIEPFAWLYRSRSQSSHILFEDVGRGWRLRGKVTLATLQNLRTVGIIPTVYNGPEIVIPVPASRVLNKECRGK